jgi:hypothetical protein
MNRLARILFPPLLLLAALPARADLASVTPTPQERSISLGAPASIAIVWTAVRNNGGNCGNTITSTQGTLYADRGVRNLPPVLLMTVPVILSQTKAECFTAIPSTTFTFYESIMIPQDTIKRYHDLGYPSLRYTRQFDEGGAGISLIANVYFNVSTSGAFGLTAMSLTFDNGSPVRVLERKEKNRAQANLGFSGVGLLQGMWEVADPSSTAGEPVYRPLSQVRQYLNGISPQSIQSPDLPTDRTGLYLVRLRVTDPAPGFELPVIRYFVADERAGVLAPKVPVSVLTPPNPSMLASDTVFAWEEIKGARAYQIEIYVKPRSAGDDLPDLGGTPAANPILPTTPPVAGMLVHGKLTRATLSAQTRSHLLPGRSYLWRVTALRADGSIAGESAVREMRIP